MIESAIEKKSRRKMSSFVTGKLNTLTDPNFPQAKYIRICVLRCLDNIKQELGDLRGTEEFKNVNLEPNLTLVKFYMKGGNAFKCLSQTAARTVTGGGTSDWDTQIVINPNLPMPIREKIYQAVEDILVEQFKKTSREIHLGLTYGTHTANDVPFTAPIPPGVFPTYSANSIRGGSVNSDIPTALAGAFQGSVAALPNAVRTQIVPAGTLFTDWDLQLDATQKLRTVFDHNKTGLFMKTGLDLSAEANSNTPQPGILFNESIGPFSLHRLGYTFHYNHPYLDLKPVRKLALGELIDVSIPRINSVEALESWDELHSHEMALIPLDIGVQNATAVNLPCPSFEYHFHETCTMIAEICSGQARSIDKCNKRTERFEAIYDQAFSVALANEIHHAMEVRRGNNPGPLLGYAVITGANLANDFMTPYKERLNNIMCKIAGEADLPAINSFRANAEAGLRNMVTDYLDNYLIATHDPGAYPGGNVTRALIKEFMFILIYKNFAPQVRAYNTLMAAGGGGVTPVHAYNQMRINFTNQPTVDSLSVRDNFDPMGAYQKNLYGTRGNHTINDIYKDCIGECLKLISKGKDSVMYQQYTRKYVNEVPISEYCSDDAALWDRLTTLNVEAEILNVKKIPQSGINFWRYVLIPHRDIIKKFLDTMRLLITTVRPGTLSMEVCEKVIQKEGDTLDSLILVIFENSQPVGVITLLKSDTQSGLGLMPKNPVTFTDTRRKEGFFTSKYNKSLIRTGLCSLRDIAEQRLVTASMIGNFYTKDRIRQQYRNIKTILDV
ncbi:hypothetical protein CJF42_19600 [Pseudoalteromonas sp. NBT06-2]|nr:hypothetical protein CJF42_19600 [Pseudoalteromonas sp. NBT06-2]